MSKIEPFVYFYHSFNKNDIEQKFVDTVEFARQQISAKGINPDWCEMTGSQMAPNGTMGLYFRLIFTVPERYQKLKAFL